jgi:hypothetical protein
MTTPNVPAMTSEREALAEILWSFCRGRIEDADIAFCRVSDAILAAGFRRSAPGCDEDFTLRDGPDGHAIINLRPCPCCGGKAALWASTPVADWRPESAGWVVRCEMPAKGGCGLATPQHKSDRQVMEWWNRRAPGWSAQLVEAIKNARIMAIFAHDPEDFTPAERLIFDTYHRLYEAPPSDTDKAREEGEGGT